MSSQESNSEKKNKNLVDRLKGVVTSPFYIGKDVLYSIGSGIENYFKLNFDGSKKQQNNNSNNDYWSQSLVKKLGYVLGYGGAFLGTASLLGFVPYSLGLVTANTATALFGGSLLYPVGKFMLESLFKKKENLWDYTKFGISLTMLAPIISFSSYATGLVSASVATAFMGLPLLYPIGYGVYYGVKGLYNGISNFFGSIFNKNKKESNGKSNSSILNDSSMETQPSPS